MRLVYIDENGNEIPVSGRPTSAENLPIAPGSTKSTAEAIDEVNGKADSFIYSDSSVANFIDLFASIPDNKTVGFLINSNTVSNCPVPYPIGVIVKRNSNTAYIQLTQLNGTDASYIGRILSGVLSWRKITTTTA